MANLSESAVWESNVYQLETDDPVLGGTNGIANLQPKQLANRTQWLKTTLAALAETVDAITIDDSEAAYEAGHVTFPNGLKIVWNKVDVTVPSGIGTIADIGIPFPDGGFSQVLHCFYSLRDKAHPGGGWEAGEMAYAIYYLGETEVTMRIKRVSGNNPYNIEKLVISILALGVA